MRIYVEECVCDVCGGPGMGRPGTLASQWLGGSVRHTNPEVCADRLKRRARELDQRGKELSHLPPNPLKEATA